MEITVATAVAVAVGALLFGIILDRWLLQRATQGQLAQAKAEAARLLQESEQQIATQRQERVERPAAALEAQRSEIAETEQTLRRSREKLETRQQKIARRVQRVNEREQMLHDAAEALETLTKETRQNHAVAAELYEQILALQENVRARQQRVYQHEKEVEALKEDLKGDRQRLQHMIDQQTRRLEQVAGLSKHEAMDALREQLLEAVKLEASSTVKEIRDTAKLQASREAKKVILTAIQRTAASHAIENTVSVVNIQSDEMKGRIIGREGRNIRAFEAATGIEVIVDDTPEAVILSGFNPVRREIARLSLIRLIQDGRIHPARIEEIVEKTKQEIEEEIIEMGERTVIDLNLHGIHPELIRLVGRMRYRTSYGQNLLAHSIETARIASLMASELGLDAAKARRGGLLHDIGKVVEGDLEAPHAIVGMELCKKYQEDPEVINAVGAHHDEIEMTTLISPIVQAADAISGARPGARREALEAYIKRLEKLESMARSFNGVERVFAIQAGREIRVLVNHDLVTDAHAEQLALDISKKIQAEMQYPGQIKVTVIREVRSVSYAK